MRYLLLIKVCFVGICLACVAKPDVTMNRLFANNMVLQHGMPVPVWGTAAAGEVVTVQFGGQTKSSTATSAGTWKITLDSLSISNIPGQMVVRGTNTITVSNILVGDVWLCSGQSNMQFGLSSFGYNAATEAVGMTSVRLLTLTTSSTWSECSPSTAGGFSATAFFYAKYLYDSLKIPLGLMVAAIGATYVEQWMSPQSVTADGDPTLLSFHTGSGDTTGPIDPRNAAGLYRMYIALVVPFAIKGVAWYQGEWNTIVNTYSHPEKYQIRFEELIKGWRKEWPQGNFPFYYVQLPNYYSTSMKWPQIREAQRLALKDVPKTGMAITIDIGDSASYHPTDKRDVGFRLALVALEKTYGHTKLVGSGPLFRSFSIIKDTAHVTFDYIGSGLVAKNGVLGGFETASKDTDFTPATAVLRGNEVIVYNPGSKVVNVRYAWVCNPHPTLFNKENLPASPFRTYASDLVGVNVPMPVSGATLNRIASGNVDIRVFDMQGRCVRIVAGKTQKPYMNSIIWDGKDECGRMVPDGCYLVRFQSRNFLQTRVLERLH